MAEAEPKWTPGAAEYAKLTPKQREDRRLKIALMNYDAKGSDPNKSQYWEIAPGISVGLSTGGIGRITHPLLGLRSPTVKADIGKLFRAMMGQSE